MTPLNSLTKLLGIGLLAAMFSCSAFAADAPKMGADKHVAKASHARPVTEPTSRIRIFRQKKPAHSAIRKQRLLKKRKIFPAPILITRHITETALTAI